MHLTIGLDTHIWGLNYAEMRACALAKAKLPDRLNVHTLPPEEYWQVLLLTFGVISESSVSHQRVTSE